MDSNLVDENNNLLLASNIMTSLGDVKLEPGQQQVEQFHEHAAHHLNHHHLNHHHHHHHHHLNSHHFYAQPVAPSQPQHQQPASHQPPAAANNQQDPQQAQQLPKQRGRRKKIRTEPVRPVCPQCEKQFSNQSALTKHKLTHSDERKFACHQCSKAFKRHDHLTGHMQTHSNRKPFNCTIQGCDKTYCDARSLRRHKENIHNIVTPKDVACNSNHNSSSSSDAPHHSDLNNNNSTSSSNNNNSNSNYLQPSVDNQQQAHNSYLHADIKPQLTNLTTVSDNNNNNQDHQAANCILVNNGQPQPQHHHQHQQQHHHQHQQHLQQQHQHPASAGYLTPTGPQTTPVELGGPPLVQYQDQQAGPDDGYQQQAVTSYHGSTSAPPPTLTGPAQSHLLQRRIQRMHSDGDAYAINEHPITRLDTIQRPIAASSDHIFQAQHTPGDYQQHQQHTPHQQQHQQQPQPLKGNELTYNHHTPVVHSAADTHYFHTANNHQHHHHHQSYSAGVVTDQVFTFELNHMTQMNPPLGQISNGCNSGPPHSACASITDSGYLTPNVIQSTPQTPNNQVCQSQTHSYPISDQQQQQTQPITRLDMVQRPIAASSDHILQGQPVTEYQQQQQQQQQLSGNELTYNHPQTIHTANNLLHPNSTNHHHHHLHHQSYSAGVVPNPQFTFELDHMTQMDSLLD